MSKMKIERGLVDQHDRPQDNEPRPMLPPRPLPEPDAMSPKARGRHNSREVECIVCERQIRTRRLWMIQMQNVPFVVVDHDQTEFPAGSESQGYFPVGFGCLRSNPWLHGYARLTDGGVEVSCSGYPGPKP